MARIIEPTPEMLVEWQQWLDKKPEVIKQLAARFDPWTLYRMKDTDQRVIIESYNEDGTMNMEVSSTYNLVL